MANEYDKILRDNFKELKTGLIRQLVGNDIVGIRPLIPKLQHTLERETDTVAEVQTADGRQLIMHIEWQSSNDTKMAERMALYDLLLHQTYRREVLGVVMYLGNDPLRMDDIYSFSRFRYQCDMVDVRQLDPELFLQSDDAGEVIFAILTGSSHPEQKTIIIRRILTKLQLLFAGDTTMLQVKIRQLEMLSLLRGKNIQQIILQEENNMPVTIDIREDLRYQQGIEQGIQQGIELEIERSRVEKERDKLELAEKMFKNGLNFSMVQNITGLSTDKLKGIMERINTTDS